jgi:hypothetical protein
MKKTCSRSAFTLPFEGPPTTVELKRDICMCHLAGTSHVRSTSGVEGIVLQNSGVFADGCRL